MWRSPFLYTRMPNATTRNAGIMRAAGGWGGESLLCMRMLV